jgi:hypothetical protein
MLKGPPVTGVCSFCEQEVTGHPVMAGRRDLILTGGGAEPLRAHYLARNRASSSARTGNLADAEREIHLPDEVEVSARWNEN